MEVERFEKALIGVDRVVAAELLGAAIEQAGLDQVITSLVVPALEHIGEEWVNGRASLSDVYMSSRIAEELIKASAPHASARREHQPKIAICALLDYHMLGKKLVQLVLKSAGYEVRDLGHGVSVEEAVERLKEANVDVLLISTLMLPSALKVKELREALRSAGLSPTIVVGGAPFRFDAALWKEVGADYMGTSASDALQILDAITEERTRGTQPHDDLV